MNRRAEKQPRLKRVKRHTKQECEADLFDLPSTSAFRYALNFGDKIVRGSIVTKF